MKDIKDYIHLYIGCEVIAKPYAGLTFTEKQLFEVRGTLIGVDYPTVAICQLRDINRAKWDTPTRLVFQDVKLILRRLSSMTEEERREYFTLRCSDSFVNSYGDITVGAIEFSNLTGESFSVKAELMHGNTPKGTFIGTEVLYKWNSRQLLYLLSKGFDLFGLIDSNLAIDSSTITENKQ